MTGEEILNIRFMCHDLNEEVSIKQYMMRLLEELLIEGEGFSGKRPFGNSGWQCDLATALVLGGAIEGEIDEEDWGDGEIHYDASGYSWKDVKKALLKAVAAL